MAYWLFKSEPTSYSFADLLAEPGRTTGWDGVRNYQARNFLRDQIKPGDGVLFYHSSADPPCIAGIAEIVKPAHPDPTAFDPNDSHYDPKSDRTTRHGSRFQSGQSGDRPAAGPSSFEQHACAQRDGALAQRKPIVHSTRQRG